MFGGDWCSLDCFGNHHSFSGLAGVCRCLKVSSATSPDPTDLHWGYSLSSQGDPAGARLPASALLCGLAQLGAASSSELLCTSNLTRTPGWPMIWAGWDLQLQGEPRKEQSPLHRRRTVLGSQRVACRETLPYPVMRQSLNQLFQKGRSFFLSITQKPYTPQAPPDLPTLSLL